MIIYTDGAHSSKTNVGGWAIVIPTIYHEPPYIAYGDWEFETTNNRMELTAVLKALDYIYSKWCCEPFGSDFDGATIYTDSAYISNCFKDGWYKLWRNNGWRTSKRATVANQDLWERILWYYELLPNITITKVAGHSDNTYNNIADQLAVRYRTEGAKFIQERHDNEET